MAKLSQATLNNSMMFHNMWEMMFNNFSHVAKQKRWHDTHGYVWGLGFKVYAVYISLHTKQWRLASRCIRCFFFLPCIKVVISHQPLCVLVTPIVKLLTIVLWNVLVKELLHFGGYGFWISIIHLVDINHLWNGDCEFWINTCIVTIVRFGLDGLLNVFLATLKGETWQPQWFQKNHFHQLL